MDTYYPSTDRYPLTLQRELTKNGSEPPINPDYFFFACRVAGIILDASYIYFNDIKNTSPQTSEQQVTRYETIDSKTH